MERALPSVSVRWERGRVVRPSDVADRLRTTLAALREAGPAYQGPWRLGAERWEPEMPDAEALAPADLVAAIGRRPERDHLDRVDDGQSGGYTVGLTNAAWVQVAVRPDHARVSTHWVQDPSAWDLPSSSLWPSLAAALGTVWAGTVEVRTRDVVLATWTPS